MTEEEIKEKLTTTIKNWTKCCVDNYYNEDFYKRYKEFADSIPKDNSNNYSQEPWEDETPIYDCKWFVFYDDEESCFCGFKTKKKALMFFNHFKEYEPILIKGNVIK